MEGLTLERRLGQRILVGNDVVITVAQLGRSKCKINITAPEDVRILREEVYLREKKKLVEETDHASSK